MTVFKILDVFSFSFLYDTVFRTESVKYTLTTPVKLDNTDLLPSTDTRLPLLYSCLGHDTQICGKIAGMLFPCFSLQVTF